MSTPENTDTQNQVGSEQQHSVDFVKRYIGKNPVILDAGCGTGATMKELSHLGETHGFDISKTALALARRRGLKNLSFGTLTDLKYKKNFT